MSEAVQEVLDRFYFKNGPCCAGCDWWQFISSQIGECTISEPVPADQRMSMLGIDWCSAPLSAGHIITERAHKCGKFKDNFDWASLPLPYRRKVGQI